MKTLMLIAEFLTALSLFVAFWAALALGAIMDSKPADAARSYEIPRWEAFCVGCRPGFQNLAYYDTLMQCSSDLSKWSYVVDYGKVACRRVTPR